HRGAQQLLDRRRHPLLGERQRIQRIFHFAAFNQIQHQPRLLRRDAHKPCLSSKFHLSLLRLSCRRRGRCRSRCSRRRNRSSRTTGHSRRPGCCFRRCPHRVSLELASKAELSQLVPHHVLGDVHRDKLLPVVDGNRVPDKFRNNRRAPRPGAQHFFLVPRIHGFNPPLQISVHECPFFCRTCHNLSSQLSAVSSQLLASGS